MARINLNFARSTESPMDFEYDQGHGPTSEDSPFPKGPGNGVQYKDGFAGQKRTSDQLDSPTKNSVPAMGKPEGQTYLFSATPSAKPLQFRQTSFTTPQRPIDTDFSSGPDQSTPLNAESDDTPEQVSRFAAPRSSAPLIPYTRKSEKKAPSKGLFERNVLFGRKYNNSVVRKVEKRRRRDADGDVRLAPRRASNASDSEVRPSSSDGPTRHEHHRVQHMGIVPSVLTFIDAHPGLPNTLSVYVQFILNCFFAFCLMFVLYGIFSTIRHDIDERAVMESSEIMAEMTVCAREFKENKCERESRVPAMETVCNNWEKCMARDPFKVGRSRLSASMFAEIFNSFIEPISIKAIIVSISVIVGCFAVNNLTFGLYRAKHQMQPTQSQPSHVPHPPPQQMAFPPGNEHFYTPYQYGIGRGIEHERGYALGDASPTKRLGYR